MNLLHFVAQVSDVETGRTGRPGTQCAFPRDEMVSQLGKGPRVCLEDSGFGSFVDCQFDLLEGTEQGRR